MKHSLPSEHSLTLVINGVTAQKLICSDDALKALVYGFLYNEGYISAASEIKDLAFSSDLSRAEIELDSCPDKCAVPVRLTGFGGAGLGISVIASHSTPTDKALELAENCGITLIGYIRRDNFNIYCGGERLK